MSTIKVYVAVISGQHFMVDSQTVGFHPLLSHFLKGVFQLQPPNSVQVPSPCPLLDPIILPRRLSVFHIDEP